MRHTKNVVKQIVKVNYQDWVLDEGLVWFPELVVKNTMLLCACTVYMLYYFVCLYKLPLGGLPYLSFLSVLLFHFKYHWLLLVYAYAQ